MKQSFPRKGKSRRFTPARTRPAPKLLDGGGLHPAPLPASRGKNGNSKELKRSRNGVETESKWSRNGVEKESKRSWQVFGRFPWKKERAQFPAIPNTRPAGGHVGSQLFPSTSRHGAEPRCKCSPQRVPFQAHIFPVCLASRTWTSLLPRPKNKRLIN